MGDDILTGLVLAWLPIAAALLYGSRRSGATSGLVLAYALQLVILHWLAAAIYLLPWYYHLDTEVVFAGLQESTYAMAGFTIGAVVVVPLLLRRRVEELDWSNVNRIDPRMVKMYLGLGIFSYAVLTPLVGNAPTISAIVTGGASCTVLGLALGCWNGSQETRRSTLWKWGVVTAALPFVTIMAQGFLGYGLAAAAIVFTFVASFYRPRWKVLVFGIVAAYLGMSLYVTYMRDRADIRQVVWGGESPSARIARLIDTFSTLEPFDLRNIDHLQRIDLRLNQNYLVGSAVMYLRTREELFARGETLVDALLAPIPRVLWPEKTMVAGSGNLVTRFTGIRFVEGTSVGIGQVMELYVNFGGLGVFIGFIVIGAVLGYVDLMAANRRNRGDWPGFAVWFLPGLSMLQLGGSLMEVTSSAAAALVVALLMNWLGVRHHGDGSVRIPPLAGHSGEVDTSALIR